MDRQPPTPDHLHPVTRPRSACVAVELKATGWPAVWSTAAGMTVWGVVTVREARKTSIFQMAGHGRNRDCCLALTVGLNFVSH